MAQFDFQTFQLYNLQASSAPNGINAGSFTLPTKNYVGVPIANAQPYIVLIPTLTPSPFLSTTLEAGRFFVPFAGSIQNDDVRLLMAGGQFTGVQFNYSRTLSINASAPCSVFLSCVDINNNPFTQKIDIDNSDLDITTNFAINIINSCIVTSETSVDLEFTIGMGIEMPYVDLMAFNNGSYAPSAPSMEMITNSSATTPNAAWMMIETVQNNSPYTYKIRGEFNLGGTLKFNRPIITLPSTNINAGYFIFWQIVFPYFYPDLIALSNGGPGTAEPILDLEQCYQTGEAIFGSIPDNTGWIGWSG